MALYEYPTNVTGISDYLVYVNNVSAGAFGMWSLLGFFVIAFIIMRDRGTEVAFGISGFLVSIIAIAFFFMGIINEIVLFIAILVGILGIVGMVMRGKED